MAYLLYTGFTAGITSTLLQNDIDAFKIENLVNMRLKLVTLSYILDLDEVKYFVSICLIILMITCFVIVASVLSIIGSVKSYF